MPLLEVRNLTTRLFTSDGIVHAVEDVSLTLERGETLAIVGESGCGKSMTALSLMRLVPQPPGKIVGGEVWLTLGMKDDRPPLADSDEGRGTNLLALSDAQMRAVRGRDIGMIFQEPMSALNPVMRVGDQIAEGLRVHEPSLDAASVHTRVVESLRLVGMPEPAARADDYPHQLSGGMRQRVMIAMALICRPQVLIADEPTTALDVTIQAQILALLKELQATLGMGLLLITHDLGVVAAVADRVAVMYAGRIVETAAVRDLFAHPRHPYTVGLLRAVPTFAARGTRARMATIPGHVPNLAHLPAGCPFQDRCFKVAARCRVELPALEEKSGAHLARCFYPE